MSNYSISSELSKIESKEQAIISGLQPATTYILRMLAINQIDHSSFTSSVIAKTLEEGKPNIIINFCNEYIYYYNTLTHFLSLAPNESPRNIQVQATGAGELHVTWQVRSSKNISFVN